MSEEPRDGIHFEEVILSAADAIVTVDQAQVIRSFNRGGERTFGFRSADVLGRPLSTLLPHRFRERHRDLVQAFIDGDVDMRPMNNRSDITGLRSDGSEFPAQASISKTGTGRDVMCTVILRDVTRMKELQDRLVDRAYVDPLTRLPNRLAFRERLLVATAEAERKGRFVAVGLLDLDRFKEINDSRGHLLGDQLLTAVASRLSGSVRADDTVARLGGDEFGIILADLAAEPDAGRMADVLVAALAVPFDLEDGTYRISCSLGVTVFPSDTRAIDSLVANADLAMYRAKQAGGGSAEFYRPEMTLEFRRRSQLESELRAEIWSQRIGVTYQPMTRIADGAVVGVEALARRADGTSAEEFIAIAEQSDLINSLGREVMLLVCSHVDGILGSGSRLRLSVNASPSQLRHPQFPADLLTLTERLTGRAHHVEVEVTESAWAADDPVMARTVQALADAGVTFAIDNFGTGITRFAHLLNQPLASLKLDRSLVAALPDSATARRLTRTAIAIAQTLGLRTTAVGVESPRQLSFLAEAGCEEAQGRLVGPDLVANALLVEPTAE